MPYTTPAAVSSGAVISKTTFGDVVIGDLNFLANPPACRVYHNTTQSLTDNTETTVLFNSERYDTDSMHSTSVNTGRITFNTAGLYTVGFLIEFAVGADYSIAYAALRLNGATSIGEDAYPGPAITAAASVHLKVVTTYKFAAADYVEVRALHDNTANAARNVLANGNRSPEFWATWVGLG